MVDRITDGHNRQSWWTESQMDTKDRQSWWTETQLDTKDSRGGENNRWTETEKRETVVMDKITDGQERVTTNRIADD